MNIQIEIYFSVIFFRIILMNIFFFLRFFFCFVFAEEWELSRVAINDCQKMVLILSDFALTSYRVKEINKVCRSETYTVSVKEKYGQKFDGYDSDRHKEKKERPVSTSIWQPVEVFRFVQIP